MSDDQRESQSDPLIEDGGIHRKELSESIQQFQVDMAAASAVVRQTAEAFTRAGHEFRRLGMALSQSVSTTGSLSS